MKRLHEAISRMANGGKIIPHVEDGIECVFVLPPGKELSISGRNAIILSHFTEKKNAD